MAKARTLDRRRKSVRNIRKITRTMELVATARFKRAADRATAATGYTRRVNMLVKHLSRSGLQAEHPLLAERPEPRRAILLVLSANRGLCGGYNASVLRLAMANWKRLQANIRECRLEVSGKRGISAFRFRKIQPNEAFTQFDDRPAYDDIDVLAERYMQAFETGRIDRLDVVYTRFESLGRQYPVVETLLPMTQVMSEEEEEEEEVGLFGVRPVQYEMLPSAESILDEVVPISFKAKLFKCFLDAGVSEQIARMTAMKAATDNANAMINRLAMAYNRARQGQITSELLEVISGAEALRG